jgi:hypothetical protein
MASHGEFLLCVDADSELHPNAATLPDHSLLQNPGWAQWLAILAWSAMPWRRRPRWISYAFARWGLAQLMRQNSPISSRFGAWRVTSISFSRVYRKLPWWGNLGGSTVKRFFCTLISLARPPNLTGFGRSLFWIASLGFESGHSAFIQKCPTFSLN